MNTPLINYEYIYSVVKNITASKYTILTNYRLLITIKINKFQTYSVCNCRSSKILYTIPTYNLFVFYKYVFSKTIQEYILYNL